MKIGALAEATGTPVETIRFYEREGLLPPPARADNNYRVYLPAHADNRQSAQRSLIGPEDKFVPGGLIELGWEADRTINPAAHASAQPEPRRFLPSAAVSGISIPGTGWQPSVQAALVVQPGVIGGSLERESSEPERISALALEDGTVRRDGLRAPDNVVSVTIDTTASSISRMRIEASVTPRPRSCSRSRAASRSSRRRACA